MREIVLCCLGAIQKDIEYLTPRERIKGYFVLKSEAEERGGLPIWTEQNINMLKKGEQLFIICAQNGAAYERILEEEGYDDGDDYISYKDFLLESDLDEAYSNIIGRKIAVYGVGNSYHDYKGFINTKIGTAQFLIDGDKKKQGQIIDGLTVQNPDEMEFKDDLFVIVTSTGYPAISEILEKKGKVFLRDFIFVDTLFMLSQFYGISHASGIIDNRGKKQENLLIVLAGYKEFLWNEVSSRVKKYTPVNFDICVVTVGIYSEIIRKTCDQNKWTYVSTETNKISLALNSAIALHKRAKYIYKMDEDMFLTRNVLIGMKDTLKRVQETSCYEVGFVSPLIPVNSYGYVRVLERFGLREKWESKFGEVKFTDGSAHHQTIWKDPKAAKFLWGENEQRLWDIDLLAEVLQEEKKVFSICPFRYSIGLILFERKIWSKMRMFPVGEGNDLGLDERHLCNFCMMEGRAIIIAENYIAAHFSYHAQVEEMKDYYVKRIHG